MLVGHLECGLEAGLGVARVHRVVVEQVRPVAGNERAERIAILRERVLNARRETVATMISSFLPSFLPSLLPEKLAG